MLLEEPPRERVEVDEENALGRSADPSSGSVAPRLDPVSSRSIVPGIAANESGACLVPDDLDDPAPVALAVELEEEHALPGAEAELAVAHRDRLARGAEEHRHAVRVPVADLHVLRADVLGAAVPVVVRVVVALGRDEPAEQRREVLEEAALELVDADAAGRVRRVDAGDAVA